jgi:hypothetical protein
LFIESIITGEKNMGLGVLPQSKGNSTTWKHPHSCITKEMKN